MQNHLVIMAGGVGSRFWPMSTTECPKQFIDVMGCGRTFIQLTLDRFRGIVPDENVWVVTNEKYRDIVMKQLPQVQPQHILLEPCRRNTAPCIAYVSWRIKQVAPDANLIITPSDHIVTDVIEFQRIIRLALDFTAAHDAILTLGMKPTRPETGYGYIERDKSGDDDVYPVLRFCEKPNLETAKEYIRHSEFYWNSGIFVWNVRTIVNQLKMHAPEVTAVFDSLNPYLGTPSEQEKVNELFPTCPSISIDYAVMEKANDIFVCPADFGWSDVGTWGSLITLSEKDANGNAAIGPRIELHECSNCIVHTTEERRVVIQGLDGYIVAEKDGTLLICRLSEEQRIKDFSAK
ncbi:MAG: mannose-1-phosphate guanylyltransferase [Prevotellaceae bacterium]|nr:mannose-1-phosphate guanylyltransferase [Candidatus Colivivens caballi]